MTNTVMNGKAIVHGNDFLQQDVRLMEVLQDCSGRSGKWAHKVEGSARLLLPLHEGARKGMFRSCWYFCVFVFIS